VNDSRFGNSGTMGLKDWDKPEISLNEIASPSTPSSASLSREVRRRHTQQNISVFKDPKGWYRLNYLSWRFYVFIYACLALLASVVNIIAIVAGAAAHGVDKHGRITLSEGSCSAAGTSSFFAHLFISGLGTYMLSASAYVMVRPFDIRST
jgi:hypothetical protein